MSESDVSTPLRPPIKERKKKKARLEMARRAAEEETDDIEDLTQVGETAHLSKRVPRNGVDRVEINNCPGEEAIGDSFIPGSKMIYVRTWGCTHNSSDSEYMAGMLQEEGYQITDNKELAHMWILNSCTVKSPAEDRFKNAIEEAQSKNKFVVVTGCVPQASPNSSYLSGFSKLGVQQIDRIVEIVEETFKGNVVEILGSRKVDGKKQGGAPLDLPKVRRNPLIEIIPINTGCLNKCTYCKTKQARGHLGSYPITEIVDRAKQAFSEGVKELWLTSEDTGAYGLDIGENLPKLLYKVVDVIPEGCMMRLGMTNPPYILDHLEDIANILSHPRVYSFLHMPVQSGSDFVLADMRREYFADQFRDIVKFMKGRIPGIMIATDIICGFPSETEEDFELTMELVEEFKFPTLYINQFYPRPGTPASIMRRLATEEVKNRSRRLTHLFHSYRSYDHKVGTEDTILVTEESSDEVHMVGHNKFYEQVLIPKNEKYMGQEVEVFIQSAVKHHMLAKPKDTMLYYKIMSLNLFRIFIFTTFAVSIYLYNTM